MKSLFKQEGLGERDSEVGVSIFLALFGLALELDKGPVNASFKLGIAMDLMLVALIRELLRLDGGRENVDSITFSGTELHISTVPMDCDETVYSNVEVSCLTSCSMSGRYPKRSTKRGDVTVATVALACL